MNFLKNWDFELLTFKEVEEKKKEFEIYYSVTTPISIHDVGPMFQTSFQVKGEYELYFLSIVGLEYNDEDRDMDKIRCDFLTEKEITIYESNRIWVSPSDVLEFMLNSKIIEVERYEIVSKEAIFVEYKMHNIRRNLNEQEN
jgi:hypothetical protein